MATIPGPLGMSDAVQPLPLVTAFPAVDTFTIASIRLPGKWTLTSAKRQFGWQIQKGFGLSGASVLPLGDDLVVATFKGEFWAMSDWGIYKQLRKQLFVKPTFTLGGLPISGAMGIDHPTLKALGVTQVVINMVQGEQQEEGGLWTQVVEFLEYYPPKKAPKKPDFVVPDVPVATPTALTNAQIELQQAEATLGKLQGA